MIKVEIIRLVKSLSGSEKRLFKLYCNRQAGEKDFVDLFNIINQEPIISNYESIINKFKQKHPEKSFENTAQYLLKTVTDTLILIAAKNDKSYLQYFSLMRFKILSERSLWREGQKELKKAQKISAELQDNSVQYLSHRMELDYLSTFGFSQMQEQDLVEKQMRLKRYLRNMHQIQEHSSLFELLRYKLTHTGRSLTNKDKAVLNELLVSELGLITRDTHSNFESEKIHLLFQSYFLIHVGNFKSSLKAFKELDYLFDSNRINWNFPPYDYLYTLEGILDSLRTIKYYDEMEFFITKVENLSRQKYPEYFLTIARQTFFIYKLNMLINNSKISKAIQFVKSIPPSLLERENMVDYEKITELLFYIGLSYFCKGDFRNASKHISVITAIGKVKIDFCVYKAAWLIHIIIHYELNNTEYLDYEIRSYKRAFGKTGKALQIERLVLKIIKYDPNRKSGLKKENFWKKISENLVQINDSVFEKHLLKYYDFELWIKSKFEKSLL